MDLSLTQSQEMLKATVQQFVQRENPKEVLLELEKTDTGCTPALWGKAASLGWLGMVVPEKYGGVGASLTDAAVLFQELGRGPVQGPYFSSGVLGAMILQEGASEKQKQELLPLVCNGGVTLSVAITEPGYGWGPDFVQMDATLDGKDYVLNGIKLFVPDASMASHFVCVVRTGNTTNCQENISLVLVEATSPGITVRNLPGFLSHASEVKFNQVRAPRSALLGDRPNEGWQTLDLAIQKALPILCAYQVGGCEAVFDMSVGYSRTRQQFGRAIGRFQRGQDHIVNLVNHLDAARWTTYEALWKLDSGRPARDAVHLAKAVTTEAYYQACNHAHEVHAGVGSMIEYGLVLHTKVSRTLYSYLGDPRHHRRKLAEALEL